MATTEAQPQDHLLLRTISAVLDGKADYKTLEKVTADSRASLEEFQNGFRDTMATLTPEQREACDNLIEAAEDLLEQYQGVFDLVAAYNTHRDSELLISAGSTLQRVTEQLDYVQFEIRNRALYAMGPTEIPNLNLLLKTHEAFKAGTDGGKFLQIVEGEIYQAVTQSDALEKSPVQTPETASLKLAYDFHAEGMKRLARAIVNQHHELVKQELEKAHQSFDEIRVKIGPASASVRTEGPTKSPEVNLVLGLVDSLKAGSIADHILAEALYALEASSKETRDAILRAAESPSDSVLVNEELERAKEAFELQDAALKDFSLYYEHKDINLVERGAQKLKRSAEALYLCFEELQNIADREGKTLCLRCGHYNPPSRNNCEKCNAPLPAIGRDQAVSTFETAENDPRGGPQSQEGPVLTPNLVRIYKAVDQVADGSIDIDKFLAEVVWFEGVLESNAEYEVDEPDLEKMNAEERAAAEATMKALAETEELFRAGYADMEQAMACFRRYAESEDKADLEEGVKLCDQGARKLAMVQAATKGAKN